MSDKLVRICNRTGSISGDNPILKDGEFSCDTEAGLFVIGDGQTPLSDLPRYSPKKDTMIYEFKKGQIYNSSIDFCFNRTKPNKILCELYR